MIEKEIDDGAHVQIFTSLCPLNYSLVRFRRGEGSRVYSVEHRHHLYGKLCHYFDHVVVAILVAFGAMH